MFAFNWHTGFNRFLGFFLFVCLFVCLLFLFLLNFPKRSCVKTMSADSGHRGWMSGSSAIFWKAIFTLNWFIGFSGGEFYTFPIGFMLKYVIAAILDEGRDK